MNKYVWESVVCSYRWYYSFPQRHQNPFHFLPDVQNGTFTPSWLWKRAFLSSSPLSSDLRTGLWGETTKGTMLLRLSPRSRSARTAARLVEDGFTSAPNFVTRETDSLSLSLHWLKILIAAFGVYFRLAIAVCHIVLFRHGEDLTWIFIVLRRISLSKMMATPFLFSINLIASLAPNFALLLFFYVNVDECFLMRCNRKLKIP